MNTIYKLVWNATTGSFVAASELAKGRGKKSRARGLAAALLIATSAVAMPSFASDSSQVEEDEVGQLLSAKLAEYQISNLRLGNSQGVSFAQTTSTVAPLAANGNGSLELCPGEGSTGAGYGYGSGTYGMSCTLGFSFSLNNSGASNGTAGFGDSTARVTGYLNGSLELIGQGGVSISGPASFDSAINMSGQQINSLADGIANADAVNFGQLKGTATSIASALGGNASVNADGTITGPVYTLTDGTQISGVNGVVTEFDNRVTANTTDIANLDGRVTTNETNIGQLQNDISNGAVGLVKQDATTGLITVAGSSGGNLVDFTGTDGLRRITGVENGVSDDDVVTMSQLKAAGLYDPSGDPMTVVSYDDHSLASATLGGSNGTLLNNVAAGLIASGSMQAVNGGQLFDMQSDFQSKVDALNSQVGGLDGRIGSIEQGIADGTIGGPGNGGGGTPGYGPNPGSGDNSVVVGEGANASGKDSTAVGNGANASGDSSTAVGNGAVASGSNSTATGANAQATGNNSTANGANSVASGSGSTAVGEGAKATGQDSTALGSNSSATANNSVALGAGSVADRDNTVSVGSEGHERQITNVAAGTQRTDAANWGQVQDAVNGVKDWADRKFHQVDKRINRMGAMSAAYGQMAFSAQGLETKNRLGVGVGTQGGQSAIALGYSRQLQPNMNLSFGGSASAGEVSVGAGMSFGW